MILTVYATNFAYVLDGGGGALPRRIVHCDTNSVAKYQIIVDGNNYYWQPWTSFNLISHPISHVIRILCKKCIWFGNTERIRSNVRIFEFFSPPSPANLIRNSYDEQCTKTRQVWRRRGKILKFMPRSRPHIICYLYIDTHCRNIAYELMSLKFI